MTPLSPSCRIDSLQSFFSFRQTVDVLRLDLVHPVISGNKWFKLQPYLGEAVAMKKTLLTFGGAFSNHLVASAAAANAAGIQSIGLVRGEKAPSLSPTLQQAAGYGMQLYFITREAYRQKSLPAQILEEFASDELYIVPEGGYGAKGAAGAGKILTLHDTGKYTHLFCAVGTGTTLAGLVAAADAGQKVVGISAMKNNLSLEEEIKQLLPPEKKQAFSLLHHYHFGGYARKTDELLQFMNNLYATAALPTDFVYTAKLLYAVFDLLRNGNFASSDKLLLVHTGGLQGNRSLPKGTLIFG